MAEEQEDLGQEVEIDAPEGGEQETLQQASAEEGEAEGSDKERELEDYSKNVQNRIRKLTEKYRKEERDRQEAVRVAQQLLEENQKLKGRVTQLDSGYLDQYGARVEAQVAAARQAYREAYEAGDTDKVLAAQEALSRAVGDQDRYNLAKSRAERQRHDSERLRQQPEQTQYQQPQYQQPQYQEAPQQPQVDPRAQTWAEKNTWFGQDEVMTYAAFGVHRRLVEEEGFDPQSEEYYSEVDRRMRAEFPHKFKAERKTGGAQVASASSSASRSTKQGRRSVKLTPSQVAIARKLNVPLEEYAKYVKE